MKINSQTIAVINAARSMLAEIESAARAQGIELLIADDAPAKDENGADAFDLGRLAEAADRAGDELFNVLNVAKNHCGIVMTEDQILNH